MRRRRRRTLHGRRVRYFDPTCRDLKLLTCNQENISVAQRGAWSGIIVTDLELGHVWAITEHVGQLLRSTHIIGLERDWAELEHAVKATRMPATKSLFVTLRAWRRPLLTFCRTLVTNVRGEADLTAENHKHIGRDNTNYANYRTGILLYTAVPKGRLNTYHHAQSGRAGKGWRWGCSPIQAGARRYECFKRCTPGGTDHTVKNSSIKPFSGHFQAKAAEVLEREFAAAHGSSPRVPSQVFQLGHPDLLVEVDAIAIR